MKVVILAGGMGTRLQEKTGVKPKPMVEIGGKPILTHIMEIYSSYGHTEFVIALGYKGEYIKDYFLNYYYRNNDLSISLKDGGVSVHNGDSTIKDWTIHLVNTGLDVQTGGRIKRLKNWIGEEPFLLTYGDGVSDVDISKTIEFHEKSKNLATITAVRPSARFGNLKLNGNDVVRFQEKSQLEEGWVNGGFIVLEPQVLDSIEGDDTSFEYETLKKLSDKGEITAYRHDGFWQCMDTVRDVQCLNELAANGDAPWLINSLIGKKEKKNAAVLEK